MLLRERSIFSPEMMLHKDYDRKGSVRKSYLVMSLKGLDARMN
jgi:hypothetical protein